MTRAVAARGRPSGFTRPSDLRPGMLGFHLDDEMPGVMAERDGHAVWLAARPAEVGCLPEPAASGRRPRTGPAPDPGPTV